MSQDQCCSCYISAILKCIYFLPLVRQWVFLFGHRLQDFQSCTRELEESAFNYLCSFLQSQILCQWHFSYFVSAFISPKPNIPHSDYMTLSLVKSYEIFVTRHSQTRHQYYLQLRRDLLEGRLSCHEETALYLGGLALQTEYGDCMPEVSWSVREV